MRKHLGLASECCLGICYIVHEQSDDFVAYYSPRTLRSGYIWELPHRDYINVGIHFNPKHHSSYEAREILRNYLRKNDYSVSEEDFAGAAINHDYRGCVFENVFLIGDAAGLASRVHGGGINSAVISGREIARKILDPGHVARELEQVIRTKRREERAFQFFERLPTPVQEAFLRFLLTLCRYGWFQSVVRV